MKEGFQHPYYYHAASLLMSVAPGMLGGCASATTIGYDANVKVDLFAYKTFAVIPWPRSVTATASLTECDAMAAVTRAIKSSMTKHGYREVPIEEADVIPK